ncbi:17636_t:CDS:2, partial [Gigaspora rosea]
MCEPTKKSQDFCCLQDMFTEETKKDIDTNKMPSNISVDINISQNKRESEKSRRWDPYLERVVYILKDNKFEKLFIVLRWINGQETVHWADDVYNRCPQK